jgi:MFS family permease
MLAVVQRMRRVVIRKELLAVYATVFIADLVVGIFSPTFSLYATSLGASLTLIGALSGTVGLTRILSSVPIGMISDAKGRRGVLSTGMLLLATSSFLYTVVTHPHFLLPIRVMNGLAIASTFFIGIAYVGDVVAKPDRGLAIGLYTTCMGLGFTLGSAIGGQMAAHYGYDVTYRAAAITALFGFAIAWWGLGSTRQRQIAHAPGLSLSAKLSLLVKEPHLFAASLGYLLIILMFDAAIVNFFPLYAASLFVSQATIGSMFAVRALVSTSVRLPTGVLTTRFASKSLMVVALVLGMIMVLSICCTTVPQVLTILLAGEGICFGMFLTSGQAFIAEHFTQSNRGAAMGVYGTTGSIGSTVGPLILGAAADLWGLNAVFWLAGALVFVGIVVLLYVSYRQRNEASTHDVETQGRSA